MNVAMSSTLVSSVDIRTEDLADDKSFNDLCRRLCEPARLEMNKPGSEDFLTRLERVRTIPDNIITPWGGVDILVRNHPYVEKYLVIQAGTWLAFEKHSEKDEYLTVEEGPVYVIDRAAGSSSIGCTLLEAGRSVHFKPGHEHAIIAPRNALVREQGMDYLGMDQDLIFIRNPDVTSYLSRSLK